MESSGTTILFLDYRKGRKLIELHFKGRGGGAPKWQYIVDSLHQIAEDMKREGNEIQRLNSGRSLGQGARLAMKANTAKLLIQEWSKNEHVEEALESGFLEVVSNLPPRNRL